MTAIKSFVPGSAGGPDGLRPQHLKDLISASAGDAGVRLLTRLTEFSNLCLTGHVPADLQPVFCGASLCALNKKDGGIRPIPVGRTLRRLVAKAACKVVTTKMATQFLPVQLGFGECTLNNSYCTKCVVLHINLGPVAFRAPQKQRLTLLGHT